MSAAESSKQDGKSDEETKPAFVASPGRDLTHPVEPKLAALVIVDYDGELDDSGRYTGYGRAKLKFGQSYEGEFEAGTMHGQGTFTWADGTVYNGTFIHNTITGTGRYDWPDGSFYVGEVVAGVRNGQGSMTLAPIGQEVQDFDGRIEEEQEGSASAATYEGAWSNGLRHGQGTLWYDGDRKKTYYKGSWVEGNRQGEGEMVYENGNTYVGEWSADLKHGKGRMMWSTHKQVYDGEWKEGKQHGRGEHIWLEGRAVFGPTQKLMCNRYVGDWLDGRRSGRGIFFYSNGSRYVGEFRDNMKWGHGVYTFPDGRVYEGPFTEDRIGFNDGTLEEKVATRGPVKNQSARRGSAASKKSKRKGQGRSKSIPLAGTTRNVHLNIADLFDGLGPKERASQRRSIDKLVMRWNSRLKEIYAHYATLGSLTSENTFHMNQAQFWMLAEHCGLISQQLNKVKLDRVFSCIRIEFAQSVVLARRRREAAERGVSEELETTVDDRMYIDPDDPIHEPARPILFREFVESLVRIAKIVYEDDEKLQALPDQFGALMDRRLKQNAQTASSKTVPDLGSGDAVQRALARPAAKEWILRNGDRLRGVFKSFSHRGSGGMLDVSMSTREFASMLRKYSVVKAAGPFGIMEAIMLCLESTYGEMEGFDKEDDDTNFETEMVFEEFLLALARASLVWVSNGGGVSESPAVDVVETTPSEDKEAEGSEKVDSGDEGEEETPSEQAPEDDVVAEEDDNAASTPTDAFEALRILCETCIFAA